MKKMALLLLVAFVMILVSSCSQKDCPAYSKADTEQTGKNV
jgi:PBP1b-binding outer membrane lipoprotein LpoB